MLNKIAAIVGFPVSDSNVAQVLNRIANKLPEGLTENSPSFEKEIRKAEKSVSAEGDMVVVNMMKALVAEPPQRIYKIKQSQKGARIKVAATNGIKYSFGPTWNDSVKSGKGIALVEKNREKLNHQGLMLGIESPEKLKITDLAALIAVKL